MITFISLHDNLAAIGCDIGANFYSLLAQATPAPPDPASSVARVISTDDFRVSIDEAAAAANAITKEWQRQWSGMLSGGGASLSHAFLYPALNGIGIVAAVGTLLFLVLKIGKDLNDENFTTAIPELIWPFIITLLLTPGTIIVAPGIGFIDLPGVPPIPVVETQATPYNNLAKITIEFQRLLRTLDLAVLYSPSVADITPIIVLQQRAQVMISAPSTIQTFLQRCNSGNGRSTCELDMIQQSINLLEAYGGKYGEFEWLRLRIKDLDTIKTDVFRAPDRKLALDRALARNAWLVSDDQRNSPSIPKLAASLQLGFSQMLEAAWLFTALLGPVAVGLSLLPVPAANKAGQKWIAGFFAVGSAQIIYHVIVGICSAVMLGADPPVVDPTWFSIFLGYIAPVMALGLATGGGIALWNGLQTGVSPLFKL